MASSSRSVARRAGRWRLHPIWRSTRQTWPGWYFTPVTCSITSATRASVHNSVGNPLALGPFSRPVPPWPGPPHSPWADDRVDRCASVPAFRRPPTSRASRTRSDGRPPSSRPMSAWETPLANRSAACIRRACMPAKSRRGRALEVAVRRGGWRGHAPIIPLHEALAGYYAILFSSARPWCDGRCTRADPIVCIGLERQPSRNATASNSVGSWISPEGPLRAE